jgi:hypothetical protein
MVAPWIKKKRAAQAAKKNNNKKATPVAKATATVTEAPKAPAVTVATVTEAVEETVVETTDTTTDETTEEVEETTDTSEEEAVDVHSMYKWQLVAHAEGLGHDVTGLTKAEIVSLLEQG